ncbi:MAG: OmpH family outer membrane protein [Armatimonadetes bacterium]|nr:OmpH family outer membrane protein [Armatimonadota bacterium]
MKLDTPAGYRAIILGAITLCTVVSLTGAKAGQKNPDGVKIAVFDQDKTRVEYKYVATARADFQQKLQDTDTKLKTWQLNALLTDADQKKLADLAVEESHAALDAPKKAEKTRLETLSKSYTEEYNALQANRNSLTPAQKDRLNILVRGASDTDARINEAQAKARTDFQNLDNDVSAKIMKDARESVSKIAKDKGYTVVFSSAVAWYGENDITDAVIKDLNSKK